MSDTLSAMREYRFLEDKRSASGLSETEESRWRELSNQLQQAPAEPAQVDPVAYAQSLVAQGYDPVQAFLHVGYTLDQIAAAGYDTTAYQQAQQSYDPQAYAQALIAQGYDAATAYAAAGLPVPEAPAVATAAEAVAAVEPAPEPAAPAEVDFADAELVTEDSTAKADGADPTGGWTASAASRPPSREQPVVLSDAWRSPQPPESLPEPARVVPMVDDLAQSAADVVHDATYGLDPRLEAPPAAPDAPAATLEPVAAAPEDPFAPSSPLPLPEGLQHDGPVLAASTEAASEPQPEVFSGANAGMSQLDLGGGDTGDVELAGAGAQAGGGLEGIREIDLGASEDVSFELDTGAQAGAAPVDFGGTLALETEPAPEPIVEPPPAMGLAPAPEPVVEPAPQVELAAEPEPVVEPVPEPEPEPVVEPAPAIELAPEPEPVVEAAPAMELAPNPEPVVEAAPAMELAPEPEPVVEAAPAMELAPEPVVEAAPGVDASSPPWPTRSELSEWRSADKADYVGWSYNSGGIEPYADLPAEAFAPESADAGAAPAAPEFEAEVLDMSDAVEQPVVEAAPVLEAEPVIEAAPVLEAEPVIEAAPILEAAPVLDAAPMLEAAPVLEAEPVIEESAVVIDESEFVPGPAAAPRAPPVVKGESRVIVHLVEGAVKRGTVQDVDLGAQALVLQSQVGAESIGRERIKAVFFMLPPGSPAPKIEGAKLRITFHDGRQLVGYSDAYEGKAEGFFVVPADARTNTERIFVYQAAVRTVARG